MIPYFLLINVQATPKALLVKIYLWKIFFETNLTVFKNKETVSEVNV